MRSHTDRQLIYIKEERFTWGIKAQHSIGVVPIQTTNESTQSRNKIYIALSARKVSVNCTKDQWQHVSPSRNLSEHDLFFAFPSIDVSRK